MGQFFDAVLFDMDGVLVNSEPVISSCSIEALKQWGVNAKEEDFIEFIGCGEDRFVGGVAEKYGVPYVPEMKDLAYRIYGERVKTVPIAAEGAADTVRKLHALGYKLALCSSADRVKVNINFDALGLEQDAFDVVISGNEVVRKKPFPDIYLDGAARLGVDPSRCIVIEDAVSGVEAAHAAGMKAIGITTSFAADEFARLAHPDHIVDGVSAIVEVIEGK